MDSSRVVGHSKAAKVPKATNFYRGLSVSWPAKRTIFYEAEEKMRRRNGDISSKGHWQIFFP
jgi:hypothetical protein